MNGRKAKEVRRAAMQQRQAGQVGRSLLNEVVVKIRNNHPDPKMQRLPGLTAVWTGEKRLYRLGKRRLQKGRPMPVFGRWFYDGLKSGQINPFGG